MTIQYIINDRLNNIKILMVKIFEQWINYTNFILNIFFLMMFKESSFQFDIDIYYQGHFSKWLLEEFRHGLHFLKKFSSTRSYDI